MPIGTHLVLPDLAVSLRIRTRSSADVSADGKWMGYRSDQSAQLEIYLQPYPGPGPTVPYLVGGSLQTLLCMTQLAVISQDPLFSSVPNVEEADLVALDLDPMPGASFDQILDVACWLHDELTRLGIPSFPKTSGSEGLHIFIPLPGTPYDAGMIFFQIVATVVETKHPDVATVERMVKRRQAGTIYIDYLQNIYGKTLAPACSARESEVCRSIDATRLDGGARGSEGRPQAGGFHTAIDLRPGRPRQ